MQVSGPAQPARSFSADPVRLGVWMIVVSVGLAAIILGILAAKGGGP